MQYVTKLGLLCLFSLSCHRGIIMLATQCSIFRAVVCVTWYVRAQGTGHMAYYYYDICSIIVSQFRERPGVRELAFYDGLMVHMICFLSLFSQLLRPFFRLIFISITISKYIIHLLKEASASLFHTT